MNQCVPRLFSRSRKPLKPSRLATASELRNLAGPPPRNSGCLAPPSTSPLGKWSLDNCSRDEYLRGHLGLFTVVRGVAFHRISKCLPPTIPQGGFANEERDSEEGAAHHARSVCGSRARWHGSGAAAE